MNFISLYRTTKYKAGYIPGESYQFLLEKERCWSWWCYHSCVIQWRQNRWSQTWNEGEVCISKALSFNLFQLFLFTCYTYSWFITFHIYQQLGLFKNYLYGVGCIAVLTSFTLKVTKPSLIMNLYSRPPNVIKFEYNLYGHNTRIYF